MEKKNKKNEGSIPEREKVRLREDGMEREAAR